MAASQYKIPLVQYDFLIPGHIWSHQAALYARYMKDKISPQFAEDYRRQVFAKQYMIASQDDLVNFTKQYMASNGKQIPFVVDPTGQYEREVQAEVDLGKKLNLQHTPTIVVVTPHRWIEVQDVSQLDAAIDQAKTWVAEPATASAHKTPTAAHLHSALWPKRKAAFWLPSLFVSASALLSLLVLTHGHLRVKGDFCRGVNL